MANIKQIQPMGDATVYDLSVRYMRSPDTRSTTINPNDLNANENGIQFDFKQKSITGLSAAYSGIISYRPYSSGSDWSGGPAHQLAFDADGIHWRKSTGDTTWQAWQDIVRNTGTWDISITGNAATATALTSNAGSSTVPIYFSGGKPVQCSTTLGVSITGNAASASAVAWGNVTGKPSTFAPSSHSHDHIDHSSTWWAGGTNAFHVYRCETSNASSIAAPTGYDCIWTHNNGNRGAALAIDWRNGQRNVFYNTKHDDTSSNNWGGGWRRIWVQGNSVTSAVWNDYAEYRETEEIDPGYILCEKGDGLLYKSTKRCQDFAGVSSDTWGFAQGETEKAKTPIAVSGRVLVYVKDKVKINDYICSGPDGIGLKMHWWEKILYPHRVVGIVSEIPTYEKWGGGEASDRPSVDVNGRIWIKCCN